MLSFPEYILLKCLHWYGVRLTSWMSWQPLSLHRFGLPQLKQGFWKCVWWVLYWPHGICQNRVSLCDAQPSVWFVKTKRRCNYNNSARSALLLLLHCCNQIYLFVKWGCVFLRCYHLFFNCVNVKFSTRQCWIHKLLNGALCFFCSSLKVIKWTGTRSSGGAVHMAKEGIIAFKAENRKLRNRCNEFSNSPKKGIFYQLNKYQSLITTLWPWI